MRALTPRYAAPEQLAGERATATDVHALGVVLRELVEDSQPIGGRARQRAELLRIAAKAKAAERDARYAGAAALADDLGDWLADRPLRSGIGSTRARLLGTLRQFRWPLLSVLGVLLAMAVGTVLTLQQAAIAEHKSAQATANLDALLQCPCCGEPGDLRRARAARQRVPDRGGAAPGAAGRRRCAADLAQPLADRRRIDQPWALRRGRGSVAARADGARSAAAARSDARTRHPAISDAGPARQRRRTSRARRRERIARVAAEPEAPVGPAISALSSAAGTLSRLGEGKAALAWLAQAELCAFPRQICPSSHWKTIGASAAGRRCACLSLRSRKPHCSSR